ncbi:hypothetical protein MKX01_018287 [Papaver californicum]|nr:hypothetical protein MKX01_018287 [Papaver californicum]
MSTISCKVHRCCCMGKGEAMEIEEVEVDPPQPMEIRIKVVCTSLCRSDVTQWESEQLDRIVESIGEGVTELREGDHVITVFTGEWLMHSDQKTHFSIKGKPIYHYCAVSSFSEYTVVHSGCAVKINPTVPLEKICLLSCGVAAGLGAAWKVADISEGSNVAIFGLGTVGLSVAQGARLRGASRIIGIDTNPDKYEKGKAFGVTDFINPADCGEPVQQVIKHITNGGADYSFECIGGTGMILLPYNHLCFILFVVSSGLGCDFTLGVPKVNPETKTHYGLLLSGKTLKGSLSDLPSMVDMYMKKEIQVDEFITHDLAFEDINNTFELMREGKCLRCVIHMPK